MKKLYLLSSFLLFPFLSTYAQEASNRHLDKAVFQNSFLQPEQKRQNSVSTRMQQDFGNVPGYGHLSVFEGQWSSTIKKITADADGNIYVAGEFSKEMAIQGNSLTDGGRKTIFLAKFAPNESLLWVKKLTTHSSGFSEARVHGVEVTGTTVLISGEYTNGAIKIGQETLATATGTGNGRPFIAVFTTDGTAVWTQSFAELDANIGNNVRGKNDNIALSDSSVFFRTKANEVTEFLFSGITARIIPLPTEAFIVDMEPLNGDLIISGVVTWDAQFGSFYVPRGLYNRMFLLRYDFATRDYVWVTSNNLGASAEVAEDNIESLPVSLDVYENEIYVTGQFNMGKELEWNGHTLYGSTGSARNSPFAAKFDANGNALWLSLLEGDGENVSGSMAANGAYLTHNSKNETFTLLASDGTLAKNASIAGSYQDFLYTSNGYWLGGANDYRFTLAKTDVNLTNISSQITDEVKAGYSQFDGLEFDSQGNLYHLATVGGKTTLFNTEFDGDGLLVAKTTAKGELIWSHLIKSAGTTSFGKNIKVNPKDSSLLITGYATEAINILGTTFTPTESLSGFVAKINSAGELQWIQNMPHELNGVEPDSKGNVYVSGMYEDAFTIGSVTSPAPLGGGDAFLIKLNASGSSLWGNFYAGDEYEYNGLVAIGPQDEVYFSGEFYSRNITLPNGNTINLSETEGDILLSKLTADGTTEWTKVYGEGELRWYGWPCSMEVTTDGNVVLTGWVGSTATFDHITLSSPYRANNFVATILPDGNTKWAKIIKTDFHPFNYNEMGLDNKGNVYVGGILNGSFEFTATAAGNTKGFYIAKYTADGAFAYAKTVNVFSSMQVGGFAISNEDDLFVNGYYAGEASFDGAPYISSSSSGFFMNLSNVPSQPSAPQAPAEPVDGETSTFTLTGKGVADEVILRVTPAGAVNSYRVEGDQLIITWNKNYDGNAGGRIAAIVEVSIEVAYRNSSGTSEFSTPFIVQLSTQPTGVEEKLFGGALKLYPNPSVTFVTAELPQVQAGAVNVYIKDISGRTIRTSSIPAGSSSTTVNTENLPKGIYLIQLTLPEGSMARRFIKN